MSAQDRDKWDTRYREGAYLERTHPGAFLAEKMEELSRQREVVAGPLRALDIACGAGRNALFLAEKGYRVDALDISAEALKRGSLSGEKLKLNDRISWLQHDLDEGLPAGLGGYDLIIMMRYLNLPVLQAATSLLNPGGQLLAEVHLQTDEAVAGPDGNRFRAAPGALKEVAGNLAVLHYSEGLSTDPDGQKVALARIWGQSKNTV